MTYLAYLIAIIFATCSLVAIAAEPAKSASPPAPNPAQVAVMPGSIQMPRQQLEFQLQTQELQLEQQILQIKEQLLRLRQMDAMQIANVPPVNIDLHWVNASDGKVPENPVIGATANDKPLYICHAAYLDGVHPGQLVEKGCLISYGGRAFVQANYQVLTGKQMVSWKPSSSLLRFNPPMLPMPSGPIFMRTTGIINFQAPEIPIPGGMEDDHPLYICRAMFENQIHLGKVVGMGCNISSQNAEVRLPTFEVLFV
jgi:hypothetical protein